MSSSACAAEAARRFAAAMAAAGGWEDAPRLAVGLSGGPDSLALARLAASWAAERGGTVVALVLDHGVRPAARIEARLAAAWAEAAGLAVVRLALPPGTALSAAALRGARLAALERAAAEAGALHLLLGHHRADQAETVLLRARRGSGPDGLAAMAPVRHLATVRLLRPLLHVTPASLKAVLQTHGQAWVEDPANASGTRGALRAALADRGGEGVAVAALAEAAVARGRARAAKEADVASLLARSATLPCSGAIRLDASVLAAAPAPLRAAAVAAVIRAVGGRATRPAPAALAAIPARLACGRGFSLGGCVLSLRAGWWHVARERRRPVAAMADRRGFGYAAA